MKILAIEKDRPGASAESFKPHLQAEAARVWELVQADILREIYFSKERHSAVLILECPDAAAARTALDTLPLVKAGLIEFDILPLVPYPGYARLFSDRT
jgi:hypothetical protein